MGVICTRIHARVCVCVRDLCSVVCMYNATHVRMYVRTFVVCTCVTLVAITRYYGDMPGDPTR